MNVRVLIHHHAFGETPYYFTGGSKLSSKEIASALDIDFEPEKNEWLSLDKIDTIYELD